VRGETVLGRIPLLFRNAGSGGLGSLLAGVTITVSILTGYIEATGHAATMLAVPFLGALNLLAIGLVGTYGRRTYENTKRRPSAIVALATRNKKTCT
jgi:hypothetical protein